MEKWAPILGIVVLLIAIVTFVNTLFRKYYSTVSETKITKIQLDNFCERVEVLIKENESIKKELTKINLEYGTSIVEIKLQLGLILKKVESI